MNYVIINIVKLVMIFSMTLCYSQQGVYKKKSVSSLDAVWIKPGAAVGTNVNVQILNDFMKFYIEVPRFDFNKLSKSQVKSFIDQANSLDEVTSENLSNAMESTVIKDIIDILNDPEIQKMRSENFKNESDFESFAATKAKSLSLTAEQLGQLMNSAYIYLPYIDLISTKYEGDDIKLNMEGGIIWWKVNISSNGAASVDEVLNATTSTFNSIDLTAKDLITGTVDKYDTYSFGDKSYKTTPEIYVQGGAMLAFAKNLNVKTRELKDFKLQAQVIEKNNSSYSFQLGLSEGAHLDDGFFLVELTEDSDGNEKTENIGFLRMSKSADTKKDPTALSTATQLFGDVGDVGSVVLEHPRLGIDVRFRLGNRSGMYIHPLHTLGYLEDISADAFMLDLDFSYNLAPIINMSQTFLDFGMSLGAPNAEYSELAIDDKIATLMWDVGLGISKKIWFGRMNVPLGLSYHYQSLSMVGTDRRLSLSGHASSISLGFEYMISADLIFNVAIEQNIPFGISSAKYKETQEDGDDIDEEYTDEEDLKPWNDENYWSDNYYYAASLPDQAMSLGGTAVRIGFDYSLRSLGFDLFGFLDPMKKY